MFIYAIYILFCFVSCIPKTVLGLQTNKIYSYVTNARGSKSINIWCVKNSDNKLYYILPAHVAIYPKDGKWKISNFLGDRQTLEWKIPKSYAENPGSQSDLCWCEPAENESSKSYIPLSNSLVNPMKVDVYFRQPYDENGKRVEIQQNLAVTEVILYNVPTNNNKAIPHLLEALNLGFRGISGAIALKKGTTELVGMFVKRGKLITLKKSKQPRSIAQTATSTRTENEIIYSPVQDFFRKLFGLNVMESRIKEEIGALREEMLEKLVLVNEKLDQTLEESDLKEVDTVFDAKRGIFLSSSSIAKLLCTEEFVHIKDLENKDAPKIERQ